jgi:CHAT domain-containing protein
MSFRNRVNLRVLLSAVAFLMIVSAGMLKGRLLTAPDSAVALAVSRSADLESDRTSLLRLGETVRRESVSTGLHSYRIALSARQYMQVTASQCDKDLEFVLYDPDGRLLTRVGCRSRGATPISVIAESSGEYELKVRSLNERTPQAGYNLHVAEIRPTIARDRDRIAAEWLCAESELLSKQSTSESCRLAISKYEEALAYWKTVGDLREQANTLISIGSIYLVFGELQRSLTYFNQALSFYRNSHDRWNEGEALNEIALVYFILGENDKEMGLCKEALRLNQTTGNRPATARALNNLGDANYNFGRLSASLENYNEALSLWRGLNDPHGQATALLSLGYDYSDLGEMRKAFDCFNQALEIWQNRSDRRWQGITLTAMGRLYTRLGESQDALNLFNHAREIIEPVGDRIELGRILSGIAYVYSLLDEKRQALDYYGQALHLYKSTGYLAAQSDMLYAIGNVYYSIGKHENALEYLEQSLSLSIAMKNMRGRADALRGIGTVYGSMGNRTKALYYYTRALPFYQNERSLRWESVTLQEIGQIHEGWGQKQKALQYYTRALSLTLAAEHRFGEASTLYNIARVERGLGKLTEARSRIEAAVRTIESLRTKVTGQDLRNSYFASVRQHYEFYVDLLMQLHAQQPDSAFDEAAFEVSERARARSLLESLTAARVGISQKVDSGLLDQERAVRMELNRKASDRILLNANHTPEEAAAIGKEVDNLSRQHRELEAQIRVASLDYATLIQQQPLKLKTIQQQAVDDDALLLEYSLGEERSYLWAVTKSGVSSYELPGRAEVEALANQVRDILTAPRFVEGESFEQRQARLNESETNYWQAASSLSKMLLGPAAAQLEKKQLIIVADGALQYIPFGALPDPQSTDDSLVPLMVDHQVTYQPSASTLATLRNKIESRQPASKMLAVFADPVFEKDDSRLSAAREPTTNDSPEQGRTETYRALRDVGIAGDGRSIPRLFASRDEANAIMAVTSSTLSLKAIGFEASKGLATGPELSQYRIIHFATHGVLDSETPELSGLVLSLFDKDGQPQDGFLRLNDVYNLDLPADLVVLSACNSALGKQIKGEGLIGLTRGFMYAGAARVMASLWKVDDEATAELIKHFYQEMLAEKKAPAEALRQAQIAMWQQKRWRSPYFWAPFVLQGEYKGTIDAGQRRQRGEYYPAILAAVITAILVLSLYAARLVVMKRQRPV